MYLSTKGGPLMPGDMVTSSSHARPSQSIRKSALRRRVRKVINGAIVPALAVIHPQQLARESALLQPY